MSSNTLPTSADCPVHGQHPHRNPDVGHRCTTCPQCMNDAAPRSRP